MILAAFLLAVSCDGADRVFGPATLVGTVTSLGTGQLLADAHLSADGVEATTNANGEFTMPGLPVGPIEVLVTHDGYDDAIQPVTLVAGMDTTRILMSPKSSGVYMDSLRFTNTAVAARITGPGSVRIGVKAYYSKYHPGQGQIDTTSIAVNTTGPFTAEWELGYVGFRALRVTASGPGTGTITISYAGNSASLEITAEDVAFKSVSLSSGYGCAIAVDDRAWCWGGNFDGVLGVSTLGVCNGSACQYGGNYGNPSPLPVTDGQKYGQVVTSGFLCYTGFASGICGRTCALTTGGKAWCWGAGSATPAPMAQDLTFQSLTLKRATSGPLRSCGLTTDGKAYCFTSTASTRVAEGMTFEAFQAGLEHFCGISSGDLYCWGGNKHANLGIGSADTVTRSDPVKVSTTDKFTAVAVGRASTCALDTTGVVQCWGYAGSSTTTTSCDATSPSCVLSPQPARGGRTYTAIGQSDAGASMCAITADGQVDCWPDFTQAPHQVLLPSPASGIAVSTGNAPLGPDIWCAVTTTGSLYCWGSAFDPKKFP
jgi:hypothetical protein